MIYNNENKMNFLEEITCSESVREGYKMIFRKVAHIEEILEKDLRHFNYEELLKVLEQLKGRSYNSVHTKWGITKKYLKHFNNEYVNLISSDDIKKNIIEDDVRYITREELKKKVSILPSYSHRALLFLLFDGVIGKAYSDICNLKYSDIDFKLHKININNKEYPISKDTVEMLKKAETETTICKLLIKDDQGYFDEEYDVNPNSPYVFKTRMLKSTDNGMTPYKLTGLQRRLDTLTKLVGLEHMNGKTLYYSGLIEKYLQLEKKFKKQLSIQDIDKFANVVGATTIQSNTMYRALQLFR